MFVTERSGRLDVRLTDGTDGRSSRRPTCGSCSEGGMLGLAVDPRSRRTGCIYTCLSSNLGAPDNRVVRWTVDPAYTGVTDRTDIVTGLPYTRRPALGVPPALRSRRRPVGRHR